jgi:catabolite repression HPr-like protein
MKKRSTTIQLENGLEARPIAILVQTASQYESSIYIETGDKKVNAKSIMGMMTLSLSSGEEVTVIAEGSDEESAVADLEKFLQGSQK